MGPEHASGEKMFYSNFFYFQSQKYEYKWIPEEQNMEITGFRETAKNVPGLA